jgi:hypothetical protein
MSKWLMIGFLGCSVATTVAGCNIENCEKGAFCGDGSRAGDWDDGGDEHEQCVHYCERLSICGAPQARDFDECVESCEDRFDRLPEQTAELCACTPRSRCEDVIDGRCTPTGGQGGTGGTSATGGSPSYGGASTTGGSSNNGGSPETGGSPATGGSWATGGSPSNGGASSAGGSPATGGSTAGGSGGSSGGDTGGAGGEDPGTPCTCSCQCPSGQSCVSGYCSG